SQPTMSTKNLAAPSNTTVSWQTFSNSQVSFKYPSTWTNSSGPQGTIDAVTSPSFTSNAVDTSTNLGAQIALTLQFSTNSSTIDCMETACVVSAVVPLSNSQLPGAVLAMVNQTSGNGTKFTEYVIAGGATKVGDMSVSAVKIGSSNIYLMGQPDY